MTKSKEEIVRGEINGYQPSMFFEGYVKYKKQFWLVPKRGKVKNNGLDNAKNKRRSGRVSRTQGKNYN